MGDSLRVVAGAVIAEKTLAAEVRRFERLQCAYQDSLVAVAAHRGDAGELRRVKMELENSKLALLELRREVFRCRSLAAAAQSARR